MYEIERLTKSEYNEAMDFVNLVFSMHSCPHDFPKLLPVLYKPTEEHMACHYVIKEEGKIKSLVGIYPAELIIDGYKLKLARIGAVSTHPKSERKHMMRTLLEFAVTKVKEEGYDLACLGGLRNRYLHFGFEKCGFKAVFEVNRKNLQLSSIEDSSITLWEVSENNEKLMEKLNALYNRQPIHLLRSSSDFFDICRSWENKLYTASVGDEVVGYCVYNDKNQIITEINADKEWFKLSIIKKMCKDKVMLEVNPADIEFARVLGSLSEAARIEDAHNWQIFNYEKVLEALLKLKNKHTQLNEGNCTFSIKDYGNVSIIVKEDKVLCERTTSQAAAEFSKEEFDRIAFGPLQPYMVTEVPKELSIIENWFPLPLCISTQDEV